MASVTNLFSRLNGVWAELTQTTLVQGDISESSVNNFDAVINKSVAQCSDDVVIGNVIRNFHRNNQEQFVQFMNGTQQQYLSLLLDGSLAHNLLGVPVDISVVWNLTTRRFNVYNNTVNDDREFHDYRPQRNNRQGFMRNGRGGRQNNGNYRSGNYNNNNYNNTNNNTNNNNDSDNNQEKPVKKEKYMLPTERKRLAKNKAKYDKELRKTLRKNGKYRNNANNTNNANTNNNTNSNRQPMMDQAYLDVLEVINNQCNNSSSCSSMYYGPEDVEEVTATHTVTWASVVSLPQQVTPSFTNTPSTNTAPTDPQDSNNVTEQLVDSSTEQSNKKPNEPLVNDFSADTSLPNDSLERQNKSWADLL